MTKLIGALFARLADLQVRRPWLVLCVVLTISALGAWRASHLELRTRFDQLLPDSAPSVVELHRVQSRTAAAQTVMISLEGDDEATLRAFGDAIVPKLAALGPHIVSSVEDGVQESRRYLQRRAGLFLSKSDLEKTRQDVDARWDWELNRALGTDLDDGPTPPLIPDQIKKRFEDSAKEKAGGRKLDQYKDGYYQRDDGKALVVLVNSPVPAGDLDRVQAAVDQMRAAVKDVQATNPAFEKVRLGWAGDMVTSLIEYSVVRDDLLHVGAIGLFLVLGVVVVYFMRLRALFVMGTTIACGLACTFGFTSLTVGYLNVATGFLFSIIAGNGINVGILFLARYYEEKRNGHSTDDAVKTAHQNTWPSTAVATVAAAAAYSSLAITQFRAFEQFALIGAAGMTLCWMVTMTLLPTLLVLVDRKAITETENTTTFFGRLRYRGVAYGQFFADLVPRIPRGVVVVGGLIAMVGIASSVAYVRNDPMEYDLSKIQNDRGNNPALSHAWSVATEILGQFPNAMVVLTDKPAQADELQALLRKRYKDAPDQAKPFEAVHSLYDFVPEEQAEKLPTLLAIADRVRHAHDRNWINEEDWKRIEPLLPNDDLKTFGIADLPASLARPFTEINGTRGTLVLIEPSMHESTEDLHYLVRYAGSFRDIALKDGTVFHGAGRAFIFADILSVVVTQIPRALGLSLVMTLVAVLVTFRRGAYSASVMAALLVGFSAVGAFLYFRHIHLNSLNFVALPITFGIGVDYAVNLMQRYQADGGKSILAALRTTGGAIVLCSLTTMLGYFALMGSHNQAIRSLGAVAVVGEISCLLAAVLVLPAAWYLVERRSSAKSDARK